jgi:dTDP-4-dehydrorhamnose 3,5-epimerase
VTQIDERGELCEIYNPAWGVSDAPLVYVYSVMIRPGKLKGWVYHAKQHDRVFVSVGVLKWVLYDLRENSPTKHMINEFYMGERRPGLLTIPPYVAHATQNVGTIEAVFVNMPTRAYEHADPDKYRIPVESGVIPYSFDTGLGW